MCVSMCVCVRVCVCVCVCAETVTEASCSAFGGDVCLIVVAEGGVQIYHQKARISVIPASYHNAFYMCRLWGWLHLYTPSVRD